MTLFGYNIVKINKVKDKINVVSKEKPLLVFDTIEGKLSGIHLAIENNEYLFPEFSSLSEEEAKVMSLKTLSVCKRLIGFMQESEDDSKD